MPEDNLKKKTVSALIWSFADRFGQQILIFVVGVVVANILHVEDYALVGMLAIFTAIGNILIDSGFGAALIQKKDADEHDYCTVFWFNLGMSVAIYLLLLACSPLIARFFCEPRLVSLSAVVFLCIPVNATILIQSTFFSKRIEFKAITQANLLSMTVAGLSALVMAFAGMGVWALALQPLIMAAVRSLIFWVKNPWKPSRYFDFKIIKGFWGYSSKLMFSSLASTIFNNIFSLVIPKIYSVRQLGYYTQANKMSAPAVTFINDSIQTATFPVFSSIQDQRERLLPIYRKSVRFTAFLAFPLLFCLAVIAPSAFHVLFKQEWWLAIPFFQLLCVGGIAIVLTSVNSNFIKVSGWSSAILKTEISKLVLTAIAVVALCRSSVLVLVAGIVTVRFVVWLICMYYTQRCVGYTMLMQLKDVVAYFAITLLASVVGYLLQFVVHGQLLLMMLQGIAVIALYLALVYATGSVVLREFLQFLKPHL